MVKVPLAKLKDGLSHYLKLATKEDVVITRHGRPAGILIGFADEDDWFEYRLTHHPDFQKQIAESVAQYKAGDVVRIEDLED